MLECHEASETLGQAYFSALLPGDKAQPLDSTRVADLVRKGLKNPRGVTIAEVYELCRAIHDSERDRA